MGKVTRTELPRYTIIALQHTEVLVKKAARRYWERHLLQNNNPDWITLNFKSKRVETESGMMEVCVEGIIIIHAVGKYEHFKVTCTWKIYKRRGVWFEIFVWGILSLANTSFYSIRQPDGISLALFAKHKMFNTPPELPKE